MIHKIVIACLICLLSLPILADEIIYTVKEGQESVPDSDKIIIKTEVATTQSEIDLKWFQDMLEMRKAEAMTAISAYNDWVDVCNAIITTLNLTIPLKKYAKATLQDTRPPGQ